MNTDKILDDFLPNKNAVYFRNFDKIAGRKKINKQEIIIKIKKIFDPEIPVNIYDLGLVYKIEIDDNNNVDIQMTLTTPNCPVAGSMPKMTGDAVSSLDGILSIRVELVWEPQWTKDMMSEDAKLALDIF